MTKRIMAIVEVHLTDEAPPFEPVAIRELAIPQQSAQHGPASCGVGAAMVVRSIVAEGGHLPPNYSWSFRESGSLRLQTLVAIAKNMIELLSSFPFLFLNILLIVGFTWCGLCLCSP